MKISLDWLKDFVDIPSKYSPKELGELLTLRTCEVDSVEDQAIAFSGVVIGKLLDFKKHPSAEKLHIGNVDVGQKVPLKVVFGSMVEMRIGDRVPVAIAPTILPTGMKVEAKQVRGELTECMLCLDQELGLKDAGVSISYFPDTKIGTPLAKALGFNDIVLEIDNKSLTHRPDLWGHYGLAREFAAFLQSKLKSYAPKITIPKTGQKVKVSLPKEIGSRFVAAIMSGIKIEDSPDWLQNRLRACGMRPVNNIVDVTNYVMLELGYPMHAFDRRVVGNDSLVVRFAKAGEKLATLDHKMRILGPEDALVTNGDVALGLAGVMGGLNCEIDSSTTEIIFEAACWDHVMIRKTSQKHGLRTDAAQRFEKSLDPEVAMLVVMRAIELILKICKGSKLVGPLTDVYNKKPTKIIVSLNTETTRSKIGAQVSEKDMVSYLKALGFGVTKGTKDTLKVSVPSFRATKDINIEEDLVEEVARMYGYEKIIPILPALPIRAPRENVSRSLEHKVREIMSLSLDFAELNHYSFYGAQEIKKCLLPEAIHLEIENPLSEDQTHMRVSLLPNILKSVAANLNQRNEFRLYEIGNTYIKDNEYFPREEKFICGVVVKAKNSDRAFYDALGALQTFFGRFQSSKIRIDPLTSPPPYAHPSKCAGVKCGENEIAAIYEVHPQILKNFDIDASVAAFEINFTRAISSGKCEFKYSPIPRFPGITIDVSVLVEKRTAVREVQELIKHSEQTLIAGISLIDIFEGANLGKDKKSLTFRVLLQSPDRTLTDAEMKTVQDNVFRVLRDRGFVIRGL